MSKSTTSKSSGQTSEQSQRTAIGSAPSQPRPIPGAAPINSNSTVSAKPVGSSNSTLSIPVPARTNSAPPETTSTEPKTASHFQAQKTHQNLTMSAPSYKQVLGQSLPPAAASPPTVSPAASAPAATSTFSAVPVAPAVSEALAQPASAPYTQNIPTAPSLQVPEGQDGSGSEEQGGAKGIGEGGESNNYSYSNRGYDGNKNKTGAGRRPNRPTDNSFSTNYNRRTPATGAPQNMYASNYQQQYGMMQQQQQQQAVNYGGQQQMYYAYGADGQAYMIDPQAYMAYMYQQQNQYPQYYPAGYPVQQQQQQQQQQMRYANNVPAGMMAASAAQMATASTVAPVVNTGQTAAPAQVPVQNALPVITPTPVLITAPAVVNPTTQSVPIVTPAAPILSPAAPIIAPATAPVASVIAPTVASIEQAKSDEAAPVAAAAAAPPLASTEIPVVIPAGPVLPTNPPKRAALKIQMKGAASAMSLDEWKKSKPVPIEASKTDGKKDESTEGGGDVKPEANPIPEMPVSISRKPKKEETPGESVAAVVEEKKEGTSPTQPPLTDSSPLIRKSNDQDSWEDADPTANVQRRLVPGGKSSGVKLTTGFQQAKKYTRAELLALKPPEDSIPRFSLMAPISVDGGGVIEPRPSRNRAPPAPAPVGADWQKGARAAPEPNEPGWSRESLPTPPPQRRAGKPAPAGPAPKKVVSDPIEKLTMDVTTLLNKITPQTFEKLTQQLLEIKLEDTNQLDRVVQIIFEKAVQEPNFAFMYADLCLALKEKGNHWLFYNVIKSIDSNQEEYFWIKDFKFPEEAIQFFSKNETMNALKSLDLPVMKPLTVTLKADSIEYILYKDVLFRLGASDMSNHHYLTYVSFENVAAEQRAQNVFPEFEAAKKEAIGELSFRGRLAHSCEREFNESVKNPNIEKLADELKELAKQRSTMDEDEFTFKYEEIEIQRSKLKTRMLGNIRFVGELYKKKLLNTDTMHDCIVELIGYPNAWKERPDDADLELLCRFLRTVGENLEAKSMKAKNKAELSVRFTQYFERLLHLSKDKNINSRIRFNIEEILDLKKNKWQERRAQEGPKKLAELHQQLQAEQLQQKSATITRQSSVSSTGNSGAGGTKILSRKDSDDVRNRAQGGRTGGPVQQTKGAPIRNNGSGNNSPLAPAGLAPQAKASAGLNLASLNLSYSIEGERRKVKSSLEEYLSGVEIAELSAFIQEGDAVIVGYFVQGILTKALTYSSASNKDFEKIMGILDGTVVTEKLVQKIEGLTEIVEAALETAQEMKEIVGHAQELMDAPQRMGKIVGKLVKLGLVSGDRVPSIMEGLKASSLDQELDAPEAIEAVFVKFTDAFKAQL